MDRSGCFYEQEETSEERSTRAVKPAYPLFTLAKCSTLSDVTLGSGPINPSVADAMVSSKIKEALETRPLWSGKRDDAELGARHGTLRAPLDQPPDALSDLEIAPLFLRSDACQATEPEGVGADRFMGPDHRSTRSIIISRTQDLARQSYVSYSRISNEIIAEP